MVVGEQDVYTVTKQHPPDDFSNSIRNHICTKEGSGFHHPYPQVSLSTAKSGAIRYNMFSDFMQHEGYNIIHGAVQPKLFDWNSFQFIKKY